MVKYFTTMVAKMRILNIFTLALIAGILSCAIADGGERVPSHLRLLGYLNTTAKDLEKFDEDMCTKNGGPGAYDAHKKSWERMQFCAYHAVIAASHLNEGEDDRTIPWETRRENSMGQYCLAVPTLENCIRNLTASMKTCLDPDKHESTNVIYNVITSLMDFMCKDDATRLKAFWRMSNDRGSCAVSKSKALEGCANQTVFKYIQTEIADGASLGRIGALHLLVPNVEKCTIVTNFQRCTIAELKNCTTSETVDLVDSMFDLVKKVTTCDHLLKSQASLNHVVNLILMSTMIAITLRFG